jgi:HTH-type transcriptional regulator/antitoxin HigA
MEIKPIRNQKHYEMALRRLESLWDSTDGSPQFDELDVLATLVEAYERQHHPIDLPDPIEAIKFRLEQQGKDTRALIGIIGQRTRVYEVLRGKRSLSLEMIRNQHDKLGIPAHVLIQPVRRSKRTGRNAAGGRNRSRKLKMSA